MIGMKANAEDQEHSPLPRRGNQTTRPEGQDRDMVMHSWFNEAYANTGGQESGMTVQGQVLNMGAAKIPAFFAPSMAMVATGIPLGI
ncbi:hypothetical protein SY88_12830 [Clostridiales bacterium PH28_bin88]|nr:hypothetical protein SY88_12830 [Clostridiales bacterium PH28_bin88]